MATAIPLLKGANGKRKRNDVDVEDAEFAPLSKRINNLHLHQNLHQSLDTIRSASLEQEHQHCITTSTCDSRNSFVTPDVASNPNNSCHIQHQNVSNPKQDVAHSRDSSSDCSHFSASPYSSAVTSCNRISVNTGETTSGFTHQKQASEQYKTCHFREDVPNNSHQAPVTVNLEYTPSLTLEANPHYYEPNKQLYMLYLERMNRTAGNLHPNFFHPE